MDGCNDHDARGRITLPCVRKTGCGTEAAKRELFACIKGDDDRQRLHSTLEYPSGDFSKDCRVFGA